MGGDRMEQIRHVIGNQKAQFTEQHNEHAFVVLL
jgi:hypothetical protein